MYHVAFLTDGPFDAFLDGRKRYEFRLSQLWAPWLAVEPGHRVLLKRTAGDVEAMGRVGHVDLFRARDGQCLEDFLARWRGHGNESDIYLHGNPLAMFGAAIEIIDLRRVTFPGHLTPRGVRMGWVADIALGDWQPP